MASRMSYQTDVPFLFMLTGSAQRWLQWFRRELESQQKTDQAIYLSLLREVEQKMRDEIAKDCMSAVMLSEGGSSGLTEVEMAYSASAPFAAGVHTVCPLEHTSGHPHQ